MSLSDPVKPTRLCRKCLKYYHFDSFNQTKKGRLRTICVTCEKSHQEQAKREWIQYQRIKRDNKKVQKMKLLITSTNENIDLTKVKSVEVKFDK